MTGHEIDRAVKHELRTLSKENALGVAAHLVMVGRLLEEDPERARLHAENAVRRAGRVAAVREARGVVAYREGDWALALSEFRTARRLSGSQHLLPLMVDCERGLGRYERALETAASPEAERLDPIARIELAIVVSGIRRDLGQPEAALVALPAAYLDPRRRDPFSARLFYAYADALLDAGRRDDARAWFLNALEADTELETDATERLEELDGIVVTDLLEGEEDEVAPDSGDDQASDTAHEDSHDGAKDVRTDADGDEVPARDSGATAEEADPARADGSARAAAEAATEDADPRRDEASADTVEPSTPETADMAEAAPEGDSAEAPRGDAGPEHGEER